MQNNRLFVGNLSYDWLTQELRKALTELFSQYGEVLEIRIPQHLDSGKHKGIAFVTMQDADSSEAAKNDLNNKLFGPDGDDSNSARPLHIDYAKPKEKRDFRNRGNDRSYKKRRRNNY